ncbi:glutamate receptor ionotropic, kainate 2-like [Cylas formicarius]|uniref:glutamate receptor ionotropic, kainate 2-like n=1 Tax=Cylas formicarius TaxID=197179 RepID=UPI0029588A28|nr:glutamate receptor ionotropic, kainate 2-like [Cylas formicarius]
MADISILTSRVAIMSALFLIKCLLVVPFVQGSRQKTVVNVAIFLQEDDDWVEITQVAIRSAVQLVKSRTSYSIQPHVYQFRGDKVYEAGEKVCDLITKGLAAIFGPESPEINELVQSLSSTLQIPQFQTIWNPRLSSLTADRSSPIFNLHPSAAALSKALATLVKDNDWKSYTIIYENDDGLLRLRESLNRRPADPAVTFRKLGPGPDYRPVLKQIKYSEDVHFILDCKAARILEVLRQAKEVNLLEDYHSYILTDLDAHTLDWTHFRNIRTNITAMRLLDPSSKALKSVTKAWKVNPPIIKTRTALLYDAFNVFVTSLADVEANNVTAAILRLDCDKRETAEHGAHLAEMARKYHDSRGILPGPLSGTISFDRQGQRQNFELQIIEYSKSEPSLFRLVGTWKSSNPNGVSYSVTSEEREKELQKEIQQKNFRVVSRLGAPYLMARVPEEGKIFYGNSRFEGYSMDIMQEICNVLNCSFTFELVPDGKYGNFDPVKKEWNGLIGHLLERKADLAICDLTITYERRRAVDFTMPFMTLGISVLYARAVKEPPELLSFSHPLSLDVWLYMATAYLVVSMIIFLVARINPNDWENPHPCDPRPTELENIWTIRNCFWLTLGSIMQQGCDLLPKGISTRMAAAMWWFFSLIMTASYTANMAAFLTMERMGPTIERAEDLAGQTKIKYGCLAGGSTCSFFKDTNFSTYHQMWIQMESADPTVFERSNADGVKRVLSSKRTYAFLMESATIEYEIERQCDLMQVGGPIDSKGYGIAMTTNFQYRKSFNEAILKMQEMGTLHRLKEKWWKEMNGGGQCAEDKQSSDEAATELGLDNVGGIFVVLAVGVAIALLFAVCEFLWNVKKVAVREHISLRESLKRELRFAFNIWDRQKRLGRRSSHLPSEEKREEIK